jgi:antitoxin VapB
VTKLAHEPDLPANFYLPKSPLAQSITAGAAMNSVANISCSQARLLSNCCHILLPYPTTFPKEHPMAQSTVFLNNRSQAVRLPAEMRFPDSVKKVEVRVVGNSRVITPAGTGWQEYFSKGPTVSDDFMSERVDSTPQEREFF